MMNVRALVFDVDGVLVEPWGFATYLKREYPTIAPQTVELFRGVFNDCLVGKADLRDVLPPLLAKWGWPHSLDEFLRLWFEMEREVDARLLAAVGQARAAGIRCYVATNQERHRVEYMRRQMGFEAHFDGIFASAQLGIKKPEMPFFEVVTSAIGVPAAQVAFWDDSQANVDAAQALGWRAELYMGYSRFCEQFGQVTGLENPLVDSRSK
jgi:putative hydrolase of the HAD superfamily